MADFCKQCSIELFGRDCGGLKGVGDSKTLPEGHGWPCICEGCGFTLVNDEGECIAPNCKKHGGK